MTDDTKKNIDLAKEIEELDNFLEEQENDFPLDDDDEEGKKPVFAPSPIEKEKIAKRKGSMGKYMVYFIFLLILAGLAYAGVVIGPRYIEKPQFEKVQNFVSSNSEDMIGDVTNKLKSLLPSSSQPTENLNNGDEALNDYDRQELSSPSDEGLIVYGDEELLDNDASVISDALKIVQEASDSVQDSVQQIKNDMNQPNRAEQQADAILNELGFADNLDPLETDTVDIANDIMIIPSEELIEIVEEKPSASPKQIVIESNSYEQAVQVVQTKKATPVKIAKPEVPTEPIDPRVVEAKLMLDNGQYEGALNLYQNILSDNPANTSALTGQQLAMAKMRLNNQPRTSIMAAPAIAQQKQIEMGSIPKPQVGEQLSMLLAKAQSSPQNAALAVQIADLYAGQGDKAKATEWYRNALKIDVMHSSGIDRMAIYDAMVDMQ